MKWFSENAPFIKKTAVSRVLEQSEMEQRAKYFLEAIEEKYGNDKQYQYIMEQTSQEHDEFYAPNKTRIESVKNTKFFIWGMKVLKWARRSELKILNAAFRDVQGLVCHCRAWSLI